MQNQIARHLEQEIAEKEDTRAHAVDGFAKAQIIEHLQLRETNIDPVEIGAEIAQHQERDEPPADFRVGLDSKLVELVCGRTSSATGEAVYFDFMFVSFHDLGLARVPGMQRPFPQGTPIINE